MRRSIRGFALALLAMQVAAQGPSDAEIRKILAERVSARRQAVGITAGIIDAAGRRVITFGDLDTTNGRPVTGSTVFEIGSITKVFT